MNFIFCNCQPNFIFVNGILKHATKYCNLSHFAINLNSEYKDKLCYYGWITTPYWILITKKVYLH